MDPQKIKDAFQATWRKGNYSYANGKYESYYKDRISHKDYDKVKGGATYQAVLSNADLHMLIRELDADYKFVKSYDVAGGTEITLTATTAYVGITLYAPKLKNLTLTNYEEWFLNGMVAEFVRLGADEEIPKEEEVAEEEKSVEELLEIYEAT